MDTEGVKYSPISGQCLQGSGSGAKMKSSAPGYLAVVAPTTLDLFLLVLTVVKVFKSSALSKSHPSSPIVCVALDFGLSLKTILRPPRCARCCAMNFCKWISGAIVERILICITSQLFYHHSKSAQISLNVLKQCPLSVDHSPQLDHSVRGRISDVLGEYCL